MCLGGVCGMRACAQERRPLKQSVRILLECILVNRMNSGLEV